MGNDWGDNIPRWRQQGRSGPNGPRYASRKDRASVRRTGKPVGRANQGSGSGGASKAAVFIITAIFGTPFLAVVGATVYVLHGHGVL